MKKPLILVCNSHIDPVWLWEWEEGVAETLSTFRTAIKFCEKYNNFVFCHNESLLYEWVEQYDPGLFNRIKEQVRTGRWHIMGGWYLQPDCNLLQGESLVRHIITGKKYFIEKFGKEPATAINFDSFGHSRGLVQVLASSGYNSYIFCRPDKNYLNLPDDTFQWIGFDGSVILAHRVEDHYNSQVGKASGKISHWIKNNSGKEKERGIILWGIGNHGGGPSENDIMDIGILKEKEENWEIKHGTPEEFFSRLLKTADELPVFKGDLNPFAIGCYTSMKQIKQPLYRLEHNYFTAEKLLSYASLSGCTDYPAKLMNEALKEILFCQFHDILPGSSVETVERNVLSRIGYANRIIEKETASLLIKAGNSLKPAESGEFPIMLINPHSFDVDQIIETELQLTEPNLEKNKRRTPELTDEKGVTVPVQTEKPLCNIREDHRKKIVFRAKIPAGGMIRYSCYLKDISVKDVKEPDSEEMIFATDRSKLTIDKGTGFPVSWEYNGEQLLDNGNMRFVVIDDNADPWGMGLKSFDSKAEEFELMNGGQVSEFAGLKERDLPAVYFSERGPVRNVIESLFTYHNSRIHLRYIIPVGEPGFDLEITVYWMEKDKLLKWIIPVGFDMNCIVRSISGINCCKHRKREYVMRDWLGMKNFDGSDTFAICADGAYGFDIIENSVRISLLRAPAYSGHPVEGEKSIVMTDRAVKRIDQGVHTFRFRFIPGNTDEVTDRSFNDSNLFNNPVLSRIVYPSGADGYKYSGITMSDATINLQAVKLSESGDMVIRLLNPCKVTKRFRVVIPSLNAETELEIGSKKLKTYIINKLTGEFLETDLLERIF